MTISSDEIINIELKRLFKKGNNVTRLDFNNIEDKYTEEVAEKIRHEFKKKYKFIENKANKFVTLIKDKYNDNNTPYHELLMKAKAFKTKYHLSAEEFSMFETFMSMGLAGKNIESIRPSISNNNMMRLLGSVTVNVQGLSYKLDDTNYKYLEEILRMYNVTRSLHSQIFIQSVAYRDCSLEAISGEYKKNPAYSAFDHIHPVLAALFIPKIPIIDRYFLHSNLAECVKLRYNSEPVLNSANNLLIDALVKDTNDVVCNNNTPLLDLLQRVNIQIQLWNNVLHLRSGNYYGSTFKEFVKNIDMCKLNKYDNPDLIYGKSDGTVLKRLFSTFSFKPTVVAIMNSQPVVSINPYYQTNTPVTSYIPMINLKLPPTFYSNNFENYKPINLQTSINQVEQFIVNGMIVDKIATVISSNLLIFYIDRRSFISHGSINPFSVTAVPIAIPGFDLIDNRDIDFEPEITVSGDLFMLRSVVVAEIINTTGSSNIRDNICAGSSALIIRPPDLDSGRFENDYILYSPLLFNKPSPTTDEIRISAKLQGNPKDAISIALEAQAAGTHTFIRTPEHAPMTTIPYYQKDSLDGQMAFRTKARKQGIIFIYTLDEGQDNIYLDQLLLKRQGGYY